MTYNTEQDETTADAVRQAAAQLQERIDKAYFDGLDVTVYLHAFQHTMRATVRPVVQVLVARPV